jgi:hypothetical protein
MSTASGIAHVCAPHISWVKDADQTILVESGGEKSWSLKGREAMVWDLLNLRYSLEGLVGLLAALLEESEEEARSYLVGLVREWGEDGIVQTVRRGQRG